MVRTARSADATVIGAPLLPSARDVEDDRRLRDLRKANNVSAILHSGYPVRFWDKDLGPDEPHLFDAADLRDLTPQPGGALREAGFDDAVFDISADGRFLVTTWRITGPEATERSVLVRVDLASGERRVIADDPDADLEHPAISPDGSAIAFTRETITTPDLAPRMTLQYLRFGDQPVSVAEAWDRRPTSLTWSSDGTSLVVTADQGGRAPVFLVELSTSTVTQLTDDDFAYTDVVAAPGGVLYALRSSYAAPPHPVRIDPGGAITVLPCVDLPTLPGTLTDVTATAADGTTAAILVGAAGGRKTQRPPRWCCGSTADRWAVGTAGHGDGTRGCWPRKVTRCCCRIRRCRPATGRNSSSVVGERGADRRSTI